MYKSLAVTALLSTTQAQTKVEGLDDCIQDVETIVKGGEEIFADFKKGDLPDIMAGIKEAVALVPTIEKAATDCKLGEVTPQSLVSQKPVGDLQSCIADLETLVSGGEELVADFKKGDFADAIKEVETLIPVIQKVTTDCQISGQNPVQLAGYGDFMTCIADIEGALNDAKAALADFQKGDTADIMAGIKEVGDMVSLVNKARTDCKMEKYKKQGEHKVGDMQQCITDLESAFADAKKAIADIQGGDIQAGIQDVTAFFGDLQKAETDCKNIVEMEMATHHHDPKKYFQWKGAEFASGFLKGSKVGDFEVKELFECLEHEDNAVKLFAEADFEIKESFEKRDPKEGIKGLDTFVEFVVDMAKENIDKKPICEMIDKDLHAWKDVGRMIEALKDPKRTLQLDGREFKFNGKDISEAGKWMVDAYWKQDFGKMGWIFAATMDKELGPGPAPGPKPGPQPCPFLVEATEFAVGFLKGAKVGDFEKEGKEIYHCLEREKGADKIFAEVEKEWKESFEKKDLKLGIHGLDESVRFIVDMALETDEEKKPLCAVIDQDREAWKDVKEMVAALKDPRRTLQADKEGHLMFNGKDISEAGKWMAESLMKKDFGKLGWLFAATMDKELHPDPSPHPRPHPDEHEVMKFAAEFAQGFLKGGKVGDFEIRDLYECLEHEPTADKIFEATLHEWEWAAKKKDAELGLKGLYDSMKFIGDMALERDQEKKPVCMAIDKTEEQWADMKKVAELMKDEKTRLGFKDGKWFFNGHDISESIEKMAKPFFEKKFGLVGFIFAETLDKEVHQDAEQFLY